MAITNATKVILVGDHKQLGPIYRSEIEGPDSMFQRLMDAEYPHIMLNEQFRIHPYLLKVPKMLFYDNKI
jgi:superfamily I DNA and/or RNA helicase